MLLYGVDVYVINNRFIFKGGQQFRKGGEECDISFVAEGTRHANQKFYVKSLLPFFWKHLGR